VVTALPYGVSKTKVIEQIANVARGGKVDDIADLRDESDRDGMRIVIELKRGANIKPILATLYKQTYLQATFGTIMLALDHGVPREFTLREMLERFRDHRVDVIQRRSRHDLEKAQAEAHIVQGLLIALEYIDEVIAVIRASKDQDEAAHALCNSFGLSEEQARAILAMRLGRLTALETDDLKKQLMALKKLIRSLEAILSSEDRQLEVLVEELDDVVGRFADARRTTIIDDVAEYEVEDLVAEEQVVITLSHESYIKRVPLDLYRRRVSSGRTIAGMDRHEDDFLEHVFIAGTQDTLVFFTQSGQAHALAVSDVPEAGPSSRGRALAQVMTLERGDRVAALIPVQEFAADKLLLFLTSGGTVKRTPLDQYANIRTGIAAIKVQGGDRLLDVQVSEGANDIVLVTTQGRAIRFSEDDVPSMGRVSQGVKGIQLRKGDGVVGMAVIRREATLCTVTANGYAKRTPVSDYPAQKRGGLGTITLDVSDRTGPLVAGKELLDGDELMVISAAGTATRVVGADIPVQGRATQGKRVINVGAGDRVVEVSRVAREGSETRRSGSEGKDQLNLM
jgi:DNA gyrase subunit A